MAWDYDAAARLAARAGFGEPPDQVERLFRLGHEGAVDFMVDYQNIDNTEFEKRIKKRFPTVQRLSTLFIAGFNPVLFENWWLTRMIITPRPLEEKMTLIWHSHFATEMSIVGTLGLKQNATLRENALARFDSLVLAVAKDPAMIFYLNNDQNLKEHANENYGRELMELHTMGPNDVVTGEDNYTQADVQAVARAFTGWTFTRASPPAFTMNTDQHDFGSKSVFGLPPANLNGEDVVTLICQRQAAARFVARKLFESFVFKLTDSDEDRAILDRFAAVYMQTDHSIKELVRAILKSNEFVSDRARFALRKSPIELVVGSIRRLGADFPVRELFSSLPAESSARMGQRLFNPPNVAGWKPEFWFNTGSLLERFNFATHLATTRTEPPGNQNDALLTVEQLAAYTVRSPEQTVDNFLRVLGPISVDAETRAAMVNYLTTTNGAPVKFKPKAPVIDKKVRNLVALILMLPEYNLI